MEGNPEIHRKLLGRWSICQSCRSIFFSLKTERKPVAKSGPDSQEMEGWSDVSIGSYL